MSRFRSRHWANEKLTELQVETFDDYVKYLPNVSFQSGGPGFARPYMRGVASGENANHSGPQPSVGIYLDEQPITTIQGALDVQIYDIARVEVLAGPQGTLYGASSQAGTIRIITNKPDPSQFDAGFDLTGSSMEGDLGYTGEGFVNIPLGERAAIRIVGWSKDEPGYIDNVQSSRVFPTSGIAVDNSDKVEENYNGWQKYGARIALGIDLNDSWTLTPTVMAQNTKTNGTFGFDPLEGDLKVAHAKNEDSEDKFVQAALTLEGKIGNWDLTYAGAFLDRDDTTRSDYADYSFFYDTCCEYGSSMVDNDGELIDPTQFIVGGDKYKKTSHELRLSSPAENRWRLTAGAFIQRQSHSIYQSYRVAESVRRLRSAGQSRCACGSPTRSARTTTTRCSASLRSISPTRFLLPAASASSTRRIRSRVSSVTARASLPAPARRLALRARNHSGAHPARTSTRRRRKTATPCVSMPPGMPPTT